MIWTDGCLGEWEGRNRRHLRPSSAGRPKQVGRPKLISVLFDHIAQLQDSTCEDFKEKILENKTILKVCKLNNEYHIPKRALTRLKSFDWYRKSWFLFEVFKKIYSSPETFPLKLSSDAMQGQKSDRRKWKYLRWNVTDKTTNLKALGTQPLSKGPRMPKTTRYKKIEKDEISKGKKTAPNLCFILALKYGTCDGRARKCRG